MRQLRQHGARRGRWVPVASALVVSAACAVLGVVVGPSAHAVDNPPAPGLPRFVLGQAWTPANKPASKANQVQNAITMGALVGGVSELTKVKQGIQLPITMSAVNLINESYFTTTKPRILSRFAAIAPVWVQSPKGVSPAFGVLPSFTTTNLAFGIIPVTATVELSQQRDAADLPIPFDVAVDSVYSSGVNYDVTLTGQLSLRLTKVAIDGHPLDIGTSCTTATPVTLDLVGKNPKIPVRTPNYYYPPVGGDLYGTIDIPAFAGCRGATGEDLSRIFTSALSADGNPVHVNQGLPGQNNIGCGPATPSAVACGQPDPIPLPTKPGEVTSLPPDYTPNPSPFDPPVILPDRPTTP